MLGESGVGWGGGVLRRAQPQSPEARVLRVFQPVRRTGARFAGAAWLDCRCFAGRGPGASAFWRCCCWLYFDHPLRCAFGQ